MKKFLHSDRLRGVQFHRNTVPKNKYLASAKARDVLTEVLKT